MPRFHLRRKNSVKNPRFSVWKMNLSGTTGTGEESWTNSSHREDSGRLAFRGVVWGDILRKESSRRQTRWCKRKPIRRRGRIHDKLRQSTGKTWKNVEREDFWKIFGKFLEDFWKSFGRFLEDFWKIFGKFWKSFGRFLEDFGPRGKRTGIFFCAGVFLFYLVDVEWFDLQADNARFYAGKLIARLVEFDEIFEDSRRDHVQFVL